ncbi:FAD-dependent oxidoreductase [Psychrobacter aquaticus]|uniref:Nitric oxide reductase FlRd-NAD(+) reductase n=1 Tax=Psychrobacter aquaticus CMS 56 TaxID=1354303 RepID=U4TAB8_9GAMM|nr:FAD-dependent oxidoreductase [Psychrobacter aquaticus]ERL55438.1 Nitric oxide reductase FlRd-NAD(+) reductase [Psychrobacter aquaticus CMS 56]
MSAENLSVTSATLSKKGVVIIGAGLAGWHVVDAIRAKDAEIPITLVTSDNGDRYHKPMLTMAISQNKRASDLVRATGSDAAKTAQVTLLANTQVTDIDTTTQQLQLISANRPDPANTDYATISYGKLVLAMGAHPIFPKSLPEDLVWHVNHIERFGQLQEKLATGSQHVAIVGAGMVGTEIAEDLLKAGHQVTLIDLNDAPLSQMLPPKATARIAQAVKSQGINFLGGYQVSDITRINEDNDAGDDEGKLQVRYEPVASITENADAKHSETLIVDHVIASTGLTVDGTLPAAAGVEFNRHTGIVVDAPTLRTTTDNIYAIGDCMSINGVACRYVAPLRAQATTIADDVLGHEHGGYDHKPPMIRLKNKAISVMATGVPRADGNWQVTSESDDELIMELLDDKGDISATVTIKAPAMPKV